MAQNDYLDFKAKKLVVLSDADMLASGYYDGKAGNKTKKLVDQLTIIDAKNMLNKTNHKKVKASNSVRAWPNNIAISKDGKYAIVAELWGEAKLGESNIHHVPVGRNLSIINLEKGKEVAKLELADAVTAVAFHPNKEILAVTTQEKGREIILLSFKNEKLKHLKNIDLEHPYNKYTAPITHIEWHPSGKFLALSNSFYMETVSFLKFNEETNELTKWGNTLKTGKMPGMSYWSPDGKFLLVTNLYWGLELDAYFVANQKGMITVIKFDEKGEGKKGAFHKIVSSGATGGGPENFAISPDGEWVVSLNMELSVLPKNHKLFNPYYTLSLFKFDRKTGVLTKKDEFLSEGIMPEGITFDKSGKYLAVAVFDSNNPNIEGGSVDFFRLIKEENPKIIKLSHYIPVMRGAHIIKRVD
jgi:DNA-binding beta-propeller fold protein YncE